MVMYLVNFNINSKEETKTLNTLILCVQAHTLIWRVKEKNWWITDYEPALFKSVDFWVTHMVFCVLVGQIT